MPPREEEVRAALTRILASPRFAGAEKLSRFLSFIVETTLAGAGAEIKEYLIALEVYQRPESYNPRVDSIVRVEASRLRTRLSEYYAAEGQTETIRISLSKGRYVPDFERRPAAPPAPEAPFPAPVPSKRSWRWAALAAMVAVCGASFAGWHFWRANEHSRDLGRAIAVLPFEDFSEESGNGRFAAGLAVEIADRLGQAGGLQVAGRTSADRYKGKSDSIHSIGQQLGVGSVLEGSVRREGDRLRITAHLASTRDGFHLWSATYDRTARDPLAIQAEVAKLIETEVRARLLEETTKAARGDGKAEAVRLSREGWDRLTNGTMDSMLDSRGDAGVPGGMFAQVTESIRLFDRAVALDAECASAYAGLAAAWLGAAEFDDQAIQHVRPAAERALALDEQSPQAHFALGYLKFFHEWDFPGAREEFLRTLESRPRDALATRLYADAATLTGDLELPLARLRAFAATDRDALAIHAEIGILLYHLRRFEELAAYSAGVQRDHPNFALSYWLGGLANEQLGRLQLAEAGFRKCLELSPGDLRGSLALAHILARTGRAKEAHKLIDELEYGQNRTIRPYGAALVAVGQGDQAGTLEQLERAFQQHYSGLAFMKVDPRFDAVRSNPRFTGMLRKLRL
ncbi:hypothetical protein [Paludibaculum fermentans]|uniref:TolB N-terminal domain-containing protein n=1 Tax=Paludibaculum fermentans TaxID=1473598 RepID=A0A7S7NUB5_PALFE|nr:hypothetical protein [Paludibaculum fermentans]QOY89878.1 hypothetical protein IRI77_07965 [Paludibaculum fermentans]